MKSLLIRLALSLAFVLPVVTLPTAAFALSTAVQAEAARQTEIPAFERITRAEAEYVRLQDLTRIPGLTLTLHPTRDLKTLKIGTQQFFIMPSEDGRLNVLDATGRETWHSAFREYGVDYVEKEFLVTIGQSQLLEAGDSAKDETAAAGPESQVPSELEATERSSDAKPQAEVASPLLASAEGVLPGVAADLSEPPAESDAAGPETAQVQIIANIPVLCYHHLLLESEMTPLQKLNGAIVSVEKFERDMAYLKSKGVTTLTMAQLQDHLAGRWTAPENSVAITFDDGYQSVYRYAYPILKKYGFTATMFVVTSTVEAAPAAWDPATTVKISWAEMNKAKNVFEYHPHSHQLHGLSSSGVPLALAVDEISLRADLQTATGLLEDKGFNRARVYAHPYGAHDTRADFILSGFGYTLAFALGDAPARASDAPFALKRYGVFPYTGTGSFDRMLNVQSLPSL